MASERSTESMLDLLYDELSAEERSEALAALEESDELRAEFDDLQVMLGRIDDAMPLEEPSPSIRASIMDAAREAATAHVEDQARAVRRVPGASEGRGFWGRLANSQLSQVALVATVLLAGAFMFKVIGTGQAPEPPMANFEERPLPTMADGVRTKEPLAEPVSEEAAEPEMKYDLEATKSEVAAVAEPLEEVAEGEASRTTKAVPRSRRQKKGQTAARDSSIGMWDEATKEAPAKKSPAAKPKPRVTTSAPKKSKKVADKKVVKKAESIDEMLFSGEASNSVRGAEAQPVDDNMAQAPSAAPSTDASPATGRADEDQKDAYRPAPGTLELVEQSYTVGDYRRTVTEADKLLGTGAPQAQKSRALELKAQAYRRMDMLSQSDAVYRNLQRNYPDYAPARVKQARGEISRILNQKRENKKRKAAPQRSYDFEAEEASPALQ